MTSSSVRMVFKGSSPNVASNMVHCREESNAGEGLSRNTDSLVSDVHDHSEGMSNSTTRHVTSEGDIDVEPHTGIEFESHEIAYQFYQEYAMSMGFITSIKNSRRSKKSRDFIDAKFACSRYGVTPESDMSSSRRPSVKKTDCKASMHVKRNKDGKWVIHELVKEHNHELLPALAYHFRIHRNVKLSEKNNVDILHAISERTKKMYVEMSRQSGGFQNAACLRYNIGHQSDKGSRLVLEEGDAQILLDYFMQIKKENPKFLYAIDLNDELHLRNFFWTDAKSRSDYVSFSDVISFDMSYMRSGDKLPLALFVGVNHHFQPILLGCALIAEETTSTFVWLMKTWLKAMGGIAPELILSNQHTALKSAIEGVFPNTRHCFPLWDIMEKLPENLVHLMKRHEKFAAKFNKCIFKSWTEERFEMRWWKMVSRFDLQEDEWFRSLYEDRKKWVPLFMGDAFLAGMSTMRRSESLNSFFDKYIQRRITLKEFIKQYGTILQNRYEEEAIADFDTWHKQPALKSPSPWEKQMSTVYTHAIFKKFQVEVLGVVGCHPKNECEDGSTVTYRVEDCEKGETFLVAWDETRSLVSCLCRLFEYRGFLCRHAMIVLQICGVSSIPSHYILRRWRKDVKSKQLIVEETQRMQSRVQRYNDLCKQALQLSKEGSSSQQSYNIALRVLVDTLKNCVALNNEGAPNVDSNAHNFHDVEEGYLGSFSTTSSKKKNAVKKRKVSSEPDAMIIQAPDNLHQMDNITIDGLTLSGYYGPQQNVQGLVQLNLMERPHDSYYVNQQSMHSLGQLNSLAPGHDALFGAQQSVHGLGHLDFRQATGFTYSLQEPNLRSSSLHGDTSRHN